MRLACLAAVAAMAALAACQPDSEKTNPAVATNEAKSDRAASAPAAGANSFTEAQARDRATKAGYADVAALTQAADGTWQGSAMKSGQAVTVVIDYQGNVTDKAPVGTAGGVAPASPASDPSVTTTTTTPAPTTPPTH